MGCTATSAPIACALDNSIARMASHFHRGRRRSARCFRRDEHRAGGCLQFRAGLNPRDHTVTPQDRRIRSAVSRCDQRRVAPVLGALRRPDPRRRAYNRSRNREARTLPRFPPSRRPPARHGGPSPWYGTPPVRPAAFRLLRPSCSQSGPRQYRTDGLLGPPPRGPRRGFGNRLSQAR